MDTRPGRIVWTDLTVPNAPQCRDFYAEVLGWKPEEVSMGEYADFNMTVGEGEPVAGICHARGVNADIPPTWMIYVAVTHLEDALAAVERLGGARLGGIREMGAWRMAVIEDPAGAVLTIGEFVGENAAGG